MTRHKISFIGTLYRFIKTLITILFRNYKTSFMITYLSAIAAIVGLVFLKRSTLLKGGQMLKALSTIDESFVHFDNQSLDNQCELINLMKETHSHGNQTDYTKKPIKERVDKKFTFLVDSIKQPKEISKISSDKEIYTQFQRFTDQTNIDSFKFFAGGKFELNSDKLSEISTFVNVFKFPFKRKKTISLDDEKGSKISSSNSAFLHNQYIAKSLHLKPFEIFFAQRDIPSMLKNGPLVMFLSFILFAYTMTISSNISFYKDLLVSKITKFLNIIGYSLFVQFVSTHFVAIIMTIPLTIPYSMIIQLFLSSSGEFVLQEIIIDFLWLAHLQFVLNCVVMSLYNLLPAFLTNMANFIVSISFFAMTMQRTPTEDDVYYKVLYYLPPINSFIYFLRFQLMTDNRTFDIFEQFKVPFKNTTLLTILSIQLSLSLFFTLFSYLLYRLDTDITTSTYMIIYKLIKKAYNLIIRKNKMNEIIDSQKNNRKIPYNRKVNINETKDKLVINKLSKSYTTFGSKANVLKSISLEINKGEKIALLGHNGCGKTTFLDSLIGLLNRSSGEVYLNRKKIYGTTDLQTKLGYCPQFTKTIPSLNVLENIQLVSDLYNIPYTEVKDILKALELYKHKSKKAIQLSGGQKRKLGFAMAIISSAPLIILDEPTTGIDVLAKKTIFRLLRNYSKESIVIFSTHLIEEAEDYADKVAILSQGNLMAFDTVTNIKRRFNIIFNRLRINFLDKINDKFIKQLEEEFNLKTVNRVNKIVNLEILETNYEHLIKLYEFMEEKRNEYNVESYGVYKASLEEVLNLQEFRELKTINDYTNIEDNKDFEIPTNNLNKRTSSISTLKALLYHTIIGLLTNYTTLIYIIIISMGVFLTFDYTRNITDSWNSNYNNKSFKIIQNDIKSFELNNIRKAKILTLNLKEDNKKVIEYFKEKSSMKNYVKIEEISKQKTEETFDKSTITNEQIKKLIENNNTNSTGKENKFDSNSENDVEQIKEHIIGQRILSLTNSEECDLFIFEITKKRLKELFNIEFLLLSLRKFKIEDILKEKQEVIDEDLKNKLLEEEEKIGKENILLVIQKYNEDLYSILFSFLFTEYTAYTINSNLDIDNKQNSVLSDKFSNNGEENKKQREIEKENRVNYKFTQKLILNKDYLNRKEELMPSNFITFFLFTIFAFSINLIGDRLIDDKESGIHTLWNINGIPKLVVFIFNITFYSAVIFYSMAIPILILNYYTYRSIAGFLMNSYLTYLLLCILLLSLLFGFLSYIFSKQTVMGIKNGIVSLTFLIHMLKKILSLFIKSDKIQHYLFWNPFYIFYELMLIILRGEVNIKTREEYYMYYATTGNTFYLGNWAMSNYIQLYLLPFIIIETGVFFIASMLAVFRLFTLLNEMIKKIEFKNIRATSNINRYNMNNKNIYNIESNNNEDKKVVLKNVTKIYGHKFFFNSNHALRNFNLKANSGDSIGVLGANGGGKTTAFKLLTRELETTFGDIYLDNKRLSSIKSGYMGYVPQYEALPQNMTPYQVLKFYAILYNWKGRKTERYIQRILTLLKLRKNKYKRIAILSGGNKRKVVLAISIMLNKELLILDEPTTGVDITNCQDIWNVVQNKTKNKTKLLASHSTRESEQLTNKIIILIEGKIVASGTKESIREEHGKYYEVEIEMFENDKELDIKLNKLKKRIEKVFNNAKIDVKNNFKFSVFVEKKDIGIAQLIKVVADWRMKYDINEFFVNESTLEDILREKLKERSH